MHFILKKHVLPTTTIIIFLTSWYRLVIFFQKVIFLCTISLINNDLKYLEAHHFRERNFIDLKNLFVLFSIFTGQKVCKPLIESVANIKAEIYE